MGTLRQDNGEMVWKTDIQGQPQSYLLVRGDMLYAANGMGLFALDTETGKIAWKCADARAAWRTRLIVHEGLIYVANRTCIAVVNASTGKMAGQLTLPEGGDLMDYDIFNGILYLSQINCLRAMPLESVQTVN